MKKQLRDAWVKALRSGEYKQATGRLKAFIVIDPETKEPRDISNPFEGDALENVPVDDPQVSVGYCCLGVLCDVVAPNGWYNAKAESYDDEGDVADEVTTADFAHHLGSSGDLLDDVLESDGLVSQLTVGETFAFPPQWSDAMNYLAHLNDTGASFGEIADWIEANITEEEEN